MNQYNDNHKYDHIINQPHHVSPTRPQMSMLERAAQFSPFAALTGYDAAVKETARLTDQRIELDENAKAALDEKLQIALGKDSAEITITYFLPDPKKDGGTYLDITGIIKKIDSFERCVIMQDGLKIPIDEIIDLEGEIFHTIL